MVVGSGGIYIYIPPTGADTVLALELLALCGGVFFSGGGGGGGGGSRCMCMWRWWLWLWGGGGG